MRLWTVVLEISVLMAQFPSREIAQRSYDFRTLGFGYANVGGLLMSSGIPYDSDAGRAICGIAVRDHDRRLLRHLGRNGGRARPVPALCRRTASIMLRVMRNHRRAAHGERTGYEQVATPPVPLDHKA